MICINCGHDDSKQPPIERDGFYVSPTGDPIYQGKISIRMTPSQRRILYALVSCDKVINCGPLLSAIGSHGMNKVITINICRMRAAFKYAQAPCPIDSDPYSGYKWALYGTKRY